MQDGAMPLRAGGGDGAGVEGDATAAALGQQAKGAAAAGQHGIARGLDGGGRLPGAGVGVQANGRVAGGLEARVGQLRLRAVDADETMAFRALGADAGGAAGLRRQEEPTDGGEILVQVDAATVVARRLDIGGAVHDGLARAQHVEAVGIQAAGADKQGRAGTGGETTVKGVRIGQAGAQLHAARVLAAGGLDIQQAAAGQRDRGIAAEHHALGPGLPARHGRGPDL